MHTGNPVYPYFRHVFGGAGLDEVLSPIKRPLPVTPLQPAVRARAPVARARPIRQLFAPVRPGLSPLLAGDLPLPCARDDVLVLVGLAYAFLVICLTQRQSMRFVLIALGPMSIAVAYVASVWCKRRTVPARLLIAILVVVMGFEASLAVARSRHVLAVLLGRESASEFLARREPTFAVGQWAARNLPRNARLIGQDHRGFYIPRDYTMELAHRRRTGLGQRGESPGEIVERLRETGFTHVMFCPPAPETAVEFDPTLGRLLGPWIAGQTALFREDLTDGDGVMRHYSIYELSPGSPSHQLSARSSGDVAR